MTYEFHNHFHQNLFDFNVYICHKKRYGNELIRNLRKSWLKQKKSKLHLITSLSNNKFNNLIILLSKNS